MAVKAIVTGQSRGLGEALAAALAGQGVEVLGLSRRRSQRLGDDVRQVEVDLSDMDAVARLAGDGTLADFLAGADTACLVNNAGMVNPIAPAGRQGAHEIATAVALNVAAPLALADAFIAVSDGIADRRIVHVSSGAARTAYAGWSIYCASKAALDHHARSVAEDAVPGLRITSLAPGVIDTDMQADIRGSSQDRFPMIDRFKAMKAEGALASPQDAAERLARYLLGDGFGGEPVTDLRNV